jgi:putative tryptophan/tyrosine transport system substrate-binding protein
MRPSRRLMLGAAGCLLAAPAAVLSQPKRMARIGYVDNTIAITVLADPARRDPGTRAFVESLSQRGWVEGSNLEILWRSAEGDAGKRPAIVDELVRRNVEALVVFGDLATADARARTSTVPIIMASSASPVRLGHVASLAKPGGNVTGVTTPAVGGKRLQLLKQAAPRITKVASITGGEFPAQGQVEARATARSLGVDWVSLICHDIRDYAPMFQEAARNGVNGMLFPVSTTLSDPKNHDEVRGLVEHYRMPAILSSLNAHVGAILNYGADPRPMHVSAAGYVDRILRGTRPADLPVEQARIFTLWANKRAARAIGLELSQSVLLLADRVIE